MPSYWKRALEIQQEYLKKLEKQDLETLNLITGKYTDLVHSLENEIIKLSKIKNKTEAEIIRMEIYQTFLRDLEKETVKYNIVVDNIISAKQSIFIQLGLNSTQDIIKLVNVNFQKLNPKALNWMIGNSIEGGRLFTLLQKSYPQTVSKITNTLIESVTIGRNPVATARLIKEDMDLNLARALRIARTETITAYRESAREQMKESGIIKQWEWLSEPDACDFCSEKNGKRFPIDEPFDTHPNCRCVDLPVI